MITLKRDEIPEVALNQLYKHTALQTTFGVNMVALVENVPRTLSLRDVIKHYVQHQREVIVRRTKHELRVLERRVHVLEGLLIALDNLDAIIELIRASRDRESARERARRALRADRDPGVGDPRPAPVAADGARGRRDQDRARRQGRADRRAARDPRRRGAGLRDHHARSCEEIADRFGDERRTVIADSEDEIGIEDLIPEQQMVITITKSGYIKSLPLTTYRAQQRGGRGVTGMDMKDGDYIEHLFVMLVARLPAVLLQPRQGLPLEGLRAAGGVADGEGPRARQRPAAARGRADPVGAVDARLHRGPLRRSSRRSAAIVKKTEFLAYNTPIKADGIIAINIRDDDELVSVRRTSGDDDILIVSRKGQAVRFNESDVRAMGRDTSGVRGMNVDQPDNEVLVMDVARDDQELLVVTENGFGKRTSIAEYRKTKRGAMGVGTIKLTDAKGALAGALVVREHEELVFISQSGMVQRTAVRGISRYGRLAQGVRLMNMKEDDLVSAVALVVESRRRRRRRRRRRGRRDRRTPRRRRARSGGAAAGVEPGGATAAAPADRSARGRRRRSLRFHGPEKGGGPNQLKFLRDPGGARPLGREGWLRPANPHRATPEPDAGLVPPARRTSCSGLKSSCTCAKGAAVAAPFVVVGCWRWCPGVWGSGASGPGTHRHVRERLAVVACTPQMFRGRNPGPHTRGIGVGFPTREPRW